MTATAGLLLVNRIVPLIVGAIARGAVKPTGCDDPEELEAEAVALAAAILDSAESKGKTLTAGNVAFYTLQALKSGRRSGYAGRMDAMSAAAVLDGAVQLKSMDEVMGVDEDDPSHEMTLHDMLAGRGDDTDVTAGRRMDWDLVIRQLDDRRVSVLQETAAGYGANEIAEMLGISAPRAIQLRHSCAEPIMDAWGAAGLQASATPSKWRSGLRARVERRTCRAERAW